MIGASLELTGRAAVLGVLQQRALQITLAVLNANGVKIGNQRRTVRLEVRDNASDPKLAARQASELAARDNVHALLGGTLAETSLGIIEAAQRIRIPFISLAYGDNIVRPLADRTFVYKVTPDARDVATQLVRLIGEHKHRRVALLAGAGMHGDSGVEAMTSAASGAACSCSGVARLPATGSDFRPIARTVRAKRPDALVIWGHPPDSGAAARALRTSSYSGPIYFDAAAVAEDTLSTRNAGAVEGAYVIHPISLNASTLTSSTMGALARRDFTFRYRDAGQCSALQGGGEGPRWEGHQGPSSALTRWLVDLLGHRHGHEGGDPAS
ncbi:ABC transporter substrate-binding protein, partial [Micromonospora sp. ATA32]|nr:ABC transporter substrate-binding protein [Micromonospora sp. ATA32]